MIHIATYSDTGDVTGLAYSNDDNAYESTNQRYVVIDAETYAALKKSAGGYIQDGKVMLRDPMPSLYHDWDVTTKSWVLNDQRRLDSMTEEVRVERLRLLEESDWTDTLSAKSRLGEDLYAQWQQYRQALRDVTQQSGFPLDVVWPIPPS